MERGEPSYNVGGNVNWCSQLFDWEDLLDKGMTTHSSIVAWRIPWTEELVGCNPWDHKELDTTKRPLIQNVLNLL